MKVTLNISMAPVGQARDTRGTFASGNDTLFERKVDWDAIPRPGDDVILDPKGGWSEPVDRVFWQIDGEVQVEMGLCFDTQGEGLEQALLDNGFKKFGSQEDNENG